MIFLIVLTFIAFFGSFILGFLAGCEFVLNKKKEEEIASKKCKGNCGCS